VRDARDNSIQTDAVPPQCRFAPVAAWRILAPMSEYVLILYPILLLGYLMLAARWQPKGAPESARSEDQAIATRGQRRQGR